MGTPLRLFRFLNPGKMQHKMRVTQTCPLLSPSLPPDSPLPSAGRDPTPHDPLTCPSPLSPSCRSHQGWVLPLGAAPAQGVLRAARSQGVPLVWWVSLVQGNPRPHNTRSVHLCWVFSGCSRQCWRGVRGV